MEEVLQYYSGEDRKGNLFCISSREAAGIITEVTRAVERGSFERFIGDRYKYAACNLSSLYKFGTVEIRTMKGATSDDQVINWLSILNDMYVYACEKMVSPAKLVSDLSFLGAEGFMKSIFSAANYRELMKTFPVIANLHLSLLEGARLLQVFAYSFEDEFVAKVEKRPAKAKAGGAVLPYLYAMPGGGLHTHYAIYRPDGGAWICHKRGAGAGDFWEDGDRLEDCPAIQWSGRLQRFVWIKRNGDIVVCRWRSHHELRDEGPPAERHPDFARAVARAARREEEDEEFEMDEEDRF